MNNAYVYMLRCSDDSLYTGWTNNIKNRLDKHNKELVQNTQEQEDLVNLFFIKK